MRPLSASILFFVVFIVASAKADETREFTITEDEIKNLKGCADEAGYKESDLEDMMEKYFKGNADTTFKCFLLCLYKADDVINNGQIDEEKLIQSHHAETTEKLKNKMLECAKSATGSDDCELAYSLSQCIYGA